MIDQDGLAVVTPHGTVAARLAWSELSILKTNGRTRGPGGEDAVLLEAAGARRTHRFIVPAEDPISLEATVALLTGTPVPDPPRKTRKRK
ncbi:MAG TPA: hypothetical protein VNC61_15840 [Acidimicrobiales bacterium]|nr:hypothetical protein [Acidimicrobiales bacterium]